jgi:hypothetical protein
MLSAMKMLRRMTVLRGITAAHMSALQTKPQVYPGVSRFKTLFTTLRVGLHWSNLIQVRASFHQVSSSGLGQIPMNEHDSHSAFTYGGCTALIESWRTSPAANRPGTLVSK